MKELKNLKPLNNKNLLVVMPIKSIEDELLNESLYALSNQTQEFDLLLLASDELSDSDIKRIGEIADEPFNRVVTQDEEGKAKSEIVKSENKLNYAIEKVSADSFIKVFNSSFNIANEAGYTWFSIIEKEDLVEEKWVEYFNIYSSELNHVSIFLPLTRQVSGGGMIGHINEAPWLEGKAEVAGQSDLQMLMAWNCLNPTGCMYKVADLKEYSEEKEGKYYPLKENLNISASYEFFLRMVYEDLKTYTIPRNGYQMRMENSSGVIDKFSSKIPSNITSLPSDKGGMSNHEVGFWMEQAKTEYFMPEDREIIYEAPEQQG